MWKHIDQQQLQRCKILKTIAPSLSPYPDVPLPLIEAIIDDESAWNPMATGDNGTSFGLLQLHLGGLADEAVKDGHQPHDLYNPEPNMHYGLPSIASAWRNMRGTFKPEDTNWWLDFCAQSGHPGGSRTDPATITEATAVQERYQFYVSNPPCPAPTPVPPTPTLHVVLNKAGEVADFADESQFQGGHSAYECVAFSAATIYYCGEPGHGPRGNGTQINQLAHYWYAVEEGGNDASYVNGMSVWSEHDMLTGMKLPYQPLASTIDAVRTAVHHGHPVMLCAMEESIYDVQLGRVPYSWPPTGSHCIVVSGVNAQGNLLVHDTASIGPSGVRWGPRTYDASKLSIVSATVVLVPWIKEEMFMVPTGWKDNGSTLTAPNNITITDAFRTYVLTHGWEPDDLPLSSQMSVHQLEDNNPTLGGGLVQFFTRTILELPYGKTLVQPTYTGKEVLALRKKAGLT